MSTSPLFLYLHIPKTGGSTLGSILYQQYQDGSQTKSEGGYFRAGIYYLPDGFVRAPGEDLTEADRRAIRRPDTAAVLGHFGFGLHRHLDRPARYMTMLRDPVQRVLSLYHHLRQYDQLPAGMTVEEFVTAPHVEEACNDQVRRLAGARVDEPCNRLTLERALRHVAQEIDLVGITERFDASLLLASHVFGWTGKINYVPRLVNTSRRQGPAVASKIITLIERRNRLDIELYRSAQQLLDQRIAAQGAGFHDQLESLTRENMTLLQTYGPASTVA